MEKPNYVLKAKESVVTFTNKNAVMEAAVIGGIIVVGIVLIVSLLAQLPAMLSWGMVLLLLLLFGRLVGWSFVGRNSLTTPSPFEIWFYDDHLVIHREKINISKKLSAKTYDKLYYKDIQKCEYKMISAQIIFTGRVESVWYNYNKDGSLPQEPTYHETTDKSSFNLTEGPDIDFVVEIESHSSLKVVLADK